MAERVARSSADLVECPARHWWVVDSVDGVKRAALLLEWRRAAGGSEWEGRVVYLAELRGRRVDRRAGVGVVRLSAPDVTGDRAGQFPPALVTSARVPRVALSDQSISVCNGQNVGTVASDEEEHP